MNKSIPLDPEHDKKVPVDIDPEHDRKVPIDIDPEHDKTRKIGYGKRKPTDKIIILPTR